MRRRLSFVAPVVAALVTLHAQSFEVASIKPNRSGSQSSTLNVQPGGRWSGVNVTAQMLILRAYRIQPSQLIGTPDWVATERFDVVATAAAGTPQEQMPLMVRALLADRFKLAVHQESRDLPIYALVLARSDGSPGPRLKPSPIADCAALPPPRAGDIAPCSMQMTDGRMQARAFDLSQLATNLGPSAGRFVVDRTGLQGRFDIDLEWTESMSAALEEQLGLKLQPEIGPVQVTIVDRIEPPTPD
jgi:uncharacterized protein (TIGR03435 family)